MPFNDISLLKKLRKLQLKIFQVQSLKEMFSMMTHEWPQLCGVESISIRKKPVSSRKGSFTVSLSTWPDHSICFFKNTPILKTEKNFLNKIAQAINDNIKKIETHHQLQTLKEQWKSTFNAIPNPLCLTDHDFHILSTNDSFLKHTKQPKQHIYRQNCFSIFFGSPLSPKEQQNLLKTKILKSLPHNQSVFEVHCQTFLKNKKEGAIRLIVFTDRTQKIEMEKNISRLADSAEMGIIASSIAHELNNPLAGIQALLQLHQEETPKDKKDQVNEMLSAVQRCQKIVHQLLTPNSEQDLKIPEIQKDKSLEIFP